MSQQVTKKQVMKLVGKNIVAVKKDGTKIAGKLLRISGNRLIVQRTGGKKVQIKAIIPLVLFDLLAVGTAPYAYGGYGYGPYSPYGPGYGYSHGYGQGGYGGGPYPYGFF
ncbi:hypothetical protein [Paenibacillus durus]|uniref:50S ribosomal protein L33 n=1 Tax=Paenibacillus durus TaxID=44251 RepID=A0A089IS34_PAEDU|nr:hypothetical protein [Paenibacillus durus]AIQ11839.1 hypothetical protein PDUR_07745 [Paenibacillus durus]